MRILKCNSTVLISRFSRASWRSLFCLRRVGKLSLSSFCLLLGFFAQAASADYSWRHSIKGGSYSSAVEACTANTPVNSSRYSFEYLGVTPNQANFNCRYTRTDNVANTVGPVSEGVAIRSGTACETPKTYNQETGACDPPPDQCESKTGQKTQFQTSSTDLMWEACISGCVVVVTEIPYVTQPKTFGPMFAGHNGVFSGEKCPQDTPGVDSSPPPVPPTESDTDTDCGPPIRTEDAEGRVHITNKCTTTDINRDNQSCAGRGGSVGMVNGVQACIQAGNGPKTVDTTKTDTKTDTKNPDGSGTKKNTTTTTTTTCKGGVCTTTTTTTNSSSNTNADGTPGSSSSSCKGDKCPGSSGSSGGGGTGGSGSGSGNGSDGEGDDEETPKSSVGGEACSANLQCSGDAVQCAILRQQKTQQCADEKFREIDEPKLKAELDQHFAQAQYQPLEATGDNVMDMSTMFDTSRSISGTCPAIENPSFNYGPVSIEVPFNNILSLICPYWAWMGYLLVAFSMWRAAEIVAKGM